MLQTIDVLLERAMNETVKEQERHNIRQLFFIRIYFSFL